MKELLDKYNTGLEIQARLTSYLKLKARDIEKVEAMLANAALPKTIEDQKYIIRCLYIR